MRHRKAGRHLNRNAAHRRSLFRNLSRALITHEQIVTTVPKAKGPKRSRRSRRAAACARQAARIS